MQFVCTSILTVIISVIDCAQPLTVIPIKLQPFGCNQAVIGRIYLQCACLILKSEFKICSETKNKITILIIAGFKKVREVTNLVNLLCVNSKFEPND